VLKDLEAKPHGVEISTHRLHDWIHSHEAIGSLSQYMDFM
jgi:hypothetical protein